MDTLPAPSALLASFKASIQDSNNNSDYRQNVEVKVIDVKKNRSLVAKRSFVVDDVLFKEQPLVSAQFAWNKFYRYKACDYCMQPLETAEENVRRLAEDSSINLPYIKENCATNKENHCACNQCGIEYCSNACRNLALDRFHASLCVGLQNNPSHPMNILMDVWKQVHLPPETTTIEIILKLIATIKQAENKEEILHKLNNFESDLFNQQSPHKLLSEKYFIELESLRELTLEVFRQQLYVKECEPWLSEQGFRRMFSLIGRNSQGIGTSPLSVWVENCDDMTEIDKSEHKKLDKFIDNIYEQLSKTSESFLNSEGAGLYELQSMINHSCEPNAEIKFKNNSSTLTLVALKEIKFGEEIYISYLDGCELSRSRHSRQKVLKENYLFACECERCNRETDQLDVTSDESLDEDDDEEEDSNEEDMED